MKRDMDLIRELLLFYESGCTVSFPSADENVIDQHMIWLIEANLLAGRLDGSTAAGCPRSYFPLDGRIIQSNDNSYTYFPLTWVGCDFLAAARDNVRWRKAKRVVGGFTFEIIKQYLQSTISASLSWPAS